MDANEWAARFRRRDDAIFNGFVARHRGAVTDVIARRLGAHEHATAEIDDLASEVFVSAWHRMSEFHGETEEDAVRWLLDLAEEAAAVRVGAGGRRS